MYFAISDKAKQQRFICLPFKLSTISKQTLKTALNNPSDNYQTATQQKGNKKPNTFPIS